MPVSPVMSTDESLWATCPICRSTWCRLALVPTISSNPCTRSISWASRTFSSSSRVFSCRNCSLARRNCSSACFRLVMFLDAPRYFTGVRSTNSTGCAWCSNHARPPVLVRTRYSVITRPAGLAGAGADLPESGRVLFGHLCEPLRQGERLREFPELVPEVRSEIPEELERTLAFDAGEGGFPQEVERPCREGAQSVPIAADFRDDALAGRHVPDDRRGDGASLASVPDVRAISTCSSVPSRRSGPKRPRLRPSSGRLDQPPSLRAVRRAPREGKRASTPRPTGRAVPPGCSRTSARPPDSRR